MFSNLRFRVKIGLGYGIVILILVLLGTYSFLTFQEANSQWEHLERKEIAKKDLIIIGNQALGNAIHHFKNYILRGEEFDKSFAADIVEIKRITAAFRTLEVNREELTQLDEIDKAADAYILEMSMLVKLRIGGATLESMDNTTKGIDKPIYDAFVKLQQQVTRDSANDTKTFGDLIHHARIIIGLLVLIAGIFSIALALWLTTTISRNITASAAQLASASSEIAATIAQHERTANQQSAAVNQTSATIEELSASSRQSAEQAANSAILAERSSAATMQGSDATQQTVVAMGSLKNGIGAMADQILHLGEQTGQIGNITTLLKDLAGQINMLALNAAVEAARAGEHGKGFAVVASEIRKLADQSKKSAEQTAVLVADIQKATNASIMMTEEGSRTVTEVTQLVLKVADLFNNLSRMAGSVNENAQQMMLNTKQQSAAFVQVVEATNSIAAGAKETVAGIGQTKIGVQNLNNAAENLKAIA